MSDRLLSLLTTLFLACALPAFAQDAEPEEEAPADLADPTDRADQTDPSDPEPAPEPEPPAAQESPPEPEPEANPEAEEEPTPEPEPTPSPEPSWTDRISRVQVASGAEKRTVEVWPGDPTEAPPAAVKISAPFAPKPLRPAPIGWRLITDAEMSPLPYSARLNDGTVISFDIKPPILIPASSEPGISIFRFSGQDGRALASELPAALQQSIKQLDATGEKLDEIITRIQAVLPQGSEEDTP